MKVFKLEYKQNLPISLEEAWNFFATPKNLSKITPKSLGFQIVSEVPDKMYSGLIVQYNVKPLPIFEIKWVTEITHIDELNYFVDEQRFGPYKFWHHKHFFKEQNGGVEIKDIVHYGLPFGFIGEIVNSLLVRKKLINIFDYRSKILKRMFPTK